MAKHSDGIVLRGGRYTLRRRVPIRYKSVEPRDVILISLYTGNLIEARQKAIKVWDDLLHGWEARLAGDDADAEKRFEAAKKLAASYGVRYLPSEDVAKVRLEDLLNRVEMVQQSMAKNGGQPDLQAVDALLGTAEKPVMTASQALTRYWDIAKDKTRGKSEDQIRRWRAPRIKAFRNFIDMKGDMSIAEISTADLVDFRNWWLEKNRGRRPDAK